MTSPLGRKVALVMYFGLWGVASCWKAWSLLAPLEEKCEAREGARDMAGGGPEAVLQQEIPVI